MSQAPQALEHILADLTEIVGSNPLEVRRKCSQIIQETILDAADAEENGIQAKATENLARLFLLAADASNKIGRQEEALRYAQQALTDAQYLQHAGLMAEALLLVCACGTMGESKNEKSDALQQLRQLAGAEKSAELTIRVDLAEAQTRLEMEDGPALTTLLSAVSARVSEESPILLRADLAKLESGLMQLNGKMEEAYVRNEEAFDLYGECGETALQATRHLQRSVLLMSQGKLQEALVEGKKVQTTFEVLGNRERYASITMILGLCESYAGRLDSAMQHYETSREILQDTDNHFELASCLSNIAEIHNSRGEHGRALLTAFDGLDLLRKHMGANTARQEIALHHIGTAYLHLGDYEQSLKYLLEAVEILETRNKKGPLIKIFGLVGKLYSTIGDFTRAEEFQRRSLALLQDYDNPYWQREIFSNLAFLAIGRNDFEAADTYFIQALQTSDIEPDPRQIAGIFNGQAAVRRSQNLPDAALALHKSALKAQDDAGALGGQVQTLKLMGELLIDIDSSAALDCLNSALTLAKKHEQQAHVPDIHQELAKAHAAAGDFQNAFEHQQVFIATQQKQQDERSKQRLDNLRVLHEVQEARHASLTLQARNQYLAAELAERERELTSKALFISNKNDLLGKLQADLERSLNAPPHELKQHVNSIMQSVRAVINNGDDWVQFDERVENVHQNFLNSVSKKYPKMTPTELRVCSLIRLNCTTKDIARIMNVSPRTAEMYRYRIRRKMTLSTSDNLQSMLSALG